MENNHVTAQTRDALVKDVANLKRDVSQIAQDVRAHADAHIEATKQLVNEKLEAMRENVSHRPLTILFVGFVLGYLFAGRRKS
jgi:hypothetical protein